MTIFLEPGGRVRVATQLDLFDAWTLVRDALHDPDAWERP